MVVESNELKIISVYWLKVMRSFFLVTLKILHFVPAVAQKKQNAANSN